MNNTITTQYPGRSLEDLKSSRRAVNNKIDDIVQQAAIIQGILPLKPGRKFWCVTEIDWANVRLSALRESYFELIQKGIHHPSIYYLNCLQPISYIFFKIYTKI